MVKNNCRCQAQKGEPRRWGWSGVRESAAALPLTTRVFEDPKQTSRDDPKFGVPVAGQRLFIQSNQLLDGWQELPVAFTGLVPASS